MTLLNPFQSKNQKIWAKGQAQLLRLLESLKSAIPPKDAELVHEFITHNENGLALEHLEYSISEFEVPRDEKILDAINQLWGLMGMPKLSSWKDIK